MKHIFILKKKKDFLTHHQNLDGFKEYRYYPSVSMAWETGHVHRPSAQVSQRYRWDTLLPRVWSLLPTSSLVSDKKQLIVVVGWRPTDLLAISQEP